MRFSAGEYAISHTPRNRVPLRPARQDKSGEFNGMLIATVRLNYLEEYLERFQMPQDVVMLLVDNTGIRLHRHPRLSSVPEESP